MASQGTRDAVRVARGYATKQLLAWIGWPAIALAAAIAAVIALGFFAVLGASQASGQGDAIYGASGEAIADIPNAWLELYQDAGTRYGLDWSVIAAIGKVECDHGRLAHPACRQSGAENFAGAGGPMQFLAGTWDAYGVDGDQDGDRDRWDPADAIPAAANYLRASGAPRDYRAAIWAYNHADWYVQKVLDQAARYRGALTAGALQPIVGADVAAVLGNPRIRLTAIQQADLRRGTINPRLVALLATIATRHTIIVTALQSDHSPGSNHEVGRAIDIGAVDGEICRGARSGPCATLARELAAIQGPLHLTELIYYWDPAPGFQDLNRDGGDDSFSRADHNDHIHAGYDG